MGNWAFVGGVGWMGGEISGLVWLLREGQPRVLCTGDKTRFTCRILDCQEETQTADGSYVDIYRDQGGTSGVRRELLRKRERAEKISTLAKRARTSNANPFHATTSNHSRQQLKENDVRTPPQSYHIVRRSLPKRPTVCRSFC
jgi:hypothetical protein